MHAMWKPKKFKCIYLLATLYVFTLTLPSAAATYWAFGDQLLTHSNAFSLLPRTPWRDAAVILMLIHQVLFFFCIFSVISHDSWTVTLTHTMLFDQEKTTNIRWQIRVKSCNWFDWLIRCMCVWIAVYNIWIRVYTIVFCVGESDWDAWYKEHLVEGVVSVTRGHTYMVLRNYIPFLWTNQLSCGGSFGQLYRLHHPCFSSYAHLSICLCSTGKWSIFSASCLHLYLMLVLYIWLALSNASTK